VTDDEKFSLGSAKRAAVEGRLAEWVIDFLSSPGSSNPELAAALAMKGTIYLGPIRFALDRLTPMAGPDGDDVIVPVAKEDWESDVEGMELSIEQGWHPPAAARVTSRRRVLPRGREPPLRDAAQNGRHLRLDDPPLRRRGGARSLPE
jgi:hypothetical protein